MEKKCPDGSCVDYTIHCRELFYLSNFDIVPSKNKIDIQSFILYAQYSK